MTEGDWVGIIAFAVVLSLLILAAGVHAQSYTCVSNVTSRVSKDVNISGTVTPISYEETCQYGCDSTQGKCKEGSLINILMLMVLLFIGIFLTFIRVDPIINSIGALVLMVMGVYMITQGISYSGYIYNNMLTFMLGLVFFLIAIYKISMVFIRGLKQ